MLNPSIRIEGPVGGLSNPPDLHDPPNPPSGTLRIHQSSGSHLGIHGVVVAGIIRIVLLRAFTRLTLRRQAARHAAPPGFGLALAPRALSLRLILVDADDQMAQQSF